MKQNNYILYKNYSEYIMASTTIQLEKTLVSRLKKAREYPRQTYNELIAKMLSAYEAARKRNQYDAFLHRIQQAKMKELWDNKDDEAWENA
jgi:hypothetical protein